MSKRKWSNNHNKVYKGATREVDHLNHSNIKNWKIQDMLVNIPKEEFDFKKLRGFPAAKAACFWQLVDVICWVLLKSTPPVTPNKRPLALEPRYHCFHFMFLDNKTFFTICTYQAHINPNYNTLALIAIAHGGFEVSLGPTLSLKNLAKVKATSPNLG